MSQDEISEFYTLGGVFTAEQSLISIRESYNTMYFTTPWFQCRLESRLIMAWSLEHFDRPDGVSVAYSWFAFRPSNEFDVHVVSQLVYLYHLWEPAHHWARWWCHVCTHISACFATLACCWVDTNKNPACTVQTFEMHNVRSQWRSWLHLVSCAWHWRHTDTNTLDLTGATASRIPTKPPSWRGKLGR